jgi:hypothetical protein
VPARALGPAEREEVGRCRRKKWRKSRAGLLPTGGEEGGAATKCSGWWAQRRPGSDGARRRGDERRHDAGFEGGGCLGKEMTRCCGGFPRTRGIPPKPKTLAQDALDAAVVQATAGMQKGRDSPPRRPRLPPPLPPPWPAAGDGSGPIKRARGRPPRYAPPCTARRRRVRSGGARWRKTSRGRPRRRGRGRRCRRGAVRQVVQRPAARGRWGSPGAMPSAAGHQLLVLDGQLRRPAARPARPASASTVEDVDVVLCGIRPHVELGCDGERAAWRGEIRAEADAGSRCDS